MSWTADSILRVILTLAVTLLAAACEDEPRIIVPDQGYAWPSNERDYWPTRGWIEAPMEAQGMDPAAMAHADEFAFDDRLSRALLVVRGGYLVFERYYGEGAADASTNLWSVTKSVTAILVGIAGDRGLFTSTAETMASLMPQYPAFGDVTLHHVLTHTTGLAWSEVGGLWDQWVRSPDWVAAALSRPRLDPPGSSFLYSSANSQFLTALTANLIGGRPGEFARQHLFEPLGIPFEPLEAALVYDDWNDYKEPLPQSWRQDPMGIETGGFCLYLRARDMAKLGYLMLNRGRWQERQVVSEQWVVRVTRDQITDVYGRYSYGYHWWITLVAGHPTFLASGLGGQLIGVVPSLDLVVVIKYEARDPVHPVAGSSHDDMGLLELVVRAVVEE